MKVFETDRNLLVPQPLEKMSDPKAAAAGDKPKTTTKLSATAGEFVPSVSCHTHDRNQTLKRRMGEGGLRRTIFAFIVF